MTAVRAFALAAAVLTCMPVAGSDQVVVDLPLPPPATPTAVAAVPPEPASTSVPSPALATAPVSRSRLAAASDAAAPSIDAEPALRRVHLTLSRGDSLFLLFRRHGLRQADLVAMERGEPDIKKTLRRMRPGQRITVEATPDGRVERMLLRRRGPRDLSIARDDSGRFRMRTVDDAVPEAAASDASSAPPPPSSSPASGSAPASREVALATARADAGPAADAPDQVAAPAPAVAPDAPVARSLTMRQVTVKRGDSLYIVFRRLGIAPAELANLLDSGDEAAALRRLRPGQVLDIGLDDQRRLMSLEVELDETRTLRAHRVAQGFDVAVERTPLESRVVHAQAVIENSLFLAGQRSGLSDRLIMQMVEIFGWDIDFALDVRAGDRFIILYEELYKNGTKLRAGNILAAEFVNRGRSVRAIRYTNDRGRSQYFSPEGLSMRKAFLRTPVKFGRISSRFSRGRMHPVLQRMRAHKGVDYAAPRGTPVKAAGDGRVTYAGRKGGYGKTVIIQHGGTYTTLYAHLSRLHKRARRGKRVQQGQIIGYVGSTGLATGPHLHYEFRVRGVHKDPLRVKLPKALPIEKRYREDFLRKSAPLVAQLDTLAKTSLALSE